MPLLSLPPRFWALLGSAFFAAFAWRASRQWWASYRAELRKAWSPDADRDGRRGPRT